MSNAENIKAILTKLVQGEVVNDSEFVIINEAISSSEKHSFQVGKYLVNIGKGEGIQIGDQHIYQGSGSETILEALRTALQDFFASQDPSSLPPAELKDAVSEFLGDIEERFRYLKLFHARQNKVALKKQYKVALKKQYIPIQVTLERIYQEKVNESLSSYGEAEEEIKRIYAAKGEKYERKQEDWQKERENHQRIVILADPGMGKSTLLRMEASCLAKKERKKLFFDDSETLTDEAIDKIIDSIQFPLYLRLSDLAEGVKKKESNDIKDIIVDLVKRDYQKSGEKIEFLVRKKLEQGQCLLLLDALDEVSSKKRDKLKSYLNPFIKDFDNKTICTSRIVGYTGFLEDAEEMEIVPFSNKQISEYIELWFENAQAAGVLENEVVSATGLINELKSKPQIQGLTQNPLLLSLVCSLYQTKGIELPARKTQVYEQAVNYMLSGWSKDNRRTSSIDGWVESKRELLEFLAYQFSCRNTEVFEIGEFKKQIDLFKRDTISSDFKDKTASYLIEELSNQDGILQKLAEDSKKPEDSKKYLFLHRTFQEYLTAAYINEVIRNDQEAGQEAGIALVRDHLWDFDWHETISLVAGLISDPIPLLDAIDKEEDDIFNTLLLLSGLCLSECPDLDHPLATKIVAKIVQFWQSYPFASFILETLIVLGKSGTKHAIEFLFRSLDHVDYDVRLMTAEALGKIGNEQSIEFLIQALDHSDSGVRRIAAETLGKSGNKQAIEFLIQAFDHFDSYIDRLGAAEALGKSCNEQAIEFLIKTLKHPDYDVRNIAEKALERSGNEQVIESLINALEHSDSYVVRGRAAEILGKISNEQAIGSLIQALDDPEGFVESYAALALREIGNEQVVAGLTRALKHSDSYVVRGRAAEILGKISNEQAIGSLIQALDDSSSDVRHKAAKALGKIGNEQAVPALIKALDNYESFVFERIVLGALGEIGNEQAVSRLIEVLNDSSSDVRHKAADALGKIGNEQAVPALIKALNDSDSDVKTYAAEALGKIGNEQAVSKLIMTLDDSDSDVRDKAADALGKIGNEQAVPALINALDHYESFIFECIVLKALGKIGNKQAISKLIMTLDDSESYLRGDAAWILGKIRNKQAVSMLVKALYNSDEVCENHVICNAAEALGEIGNEQAVLGLIKALEHSDTVGSMAAKALGKVGNEQAVPALIKALNYTGVRHDAAEALGKIGNEQAVPALIKALDDSNVDFRRKAAEALDQINSAEIVKKLMEKPNLDIYRYDIFLLARKLMVRHSQELKHPLTQNRTVPFTQNRTVLLEILNKLKEFKDGMKELLLKKNLKIKRKNF